MNVCQLGTPERRKLDKYHLFVDMDGTLAKFNKIEELEGIQSIYEKGYFRGLDPMTSVVNGIKQLKEEYSDDVHITILSSYLKDSEYALSEKNEWLDEHLPQVTDRLFLPCGKAKHSMLSDINLKGTPVLLDDYSKNLHEWTKDGDLAAIKLLNGINGSRGTWKGQTLSMESCNDPVSILSAMHLAVCTKDELRQDYFEQHLEKVKL